MCWEKILLQAAANILYHIKHIFQLIQLPLTVYKQNINTESNILHARFSQHKHVYNFCYLSVCPDREIEDLGVSLRCHPLPTSYRPRSHEGERQPRHSVLGCGQTPSESTEKAVGWRLSYRPASAAIHYTRSGSSPWKPTSRPTVPAGQWHWLGTADPTMMWHSDSLWPSVLSCRVQIREPIRSDVSVFSFSRNCLEFCQHRTLMRPRSGVEA